MNPWSMVLMESGIISHFSNHLSLRLTVTLHRQFFAKPTTFAGFHPTHTLTHVSSPSLYQQKRHTSNCRAPYHKVSAGWFKGLGLAMDKKEVTEHYPGIVKVGDPVLHEPASKVDVDQIGSENIQSIIDQMIQSMRNAPGVGLAAPQIGVPLKIVVLEDTTEYMSYASKTEIELQDRQPFDLLVIVNPTLKTKGNKTAYFFEGCLSVDGYRALVERHLEVEVTGFGRDGSPLKVNARGWQARILQHECDHLDGIVYIDKMVSRTFRTVENLSLPLPIGCARHVGPC